MCALMWTDISGWSPVAFEKYNKPYGSIDGGGFFE